MKMADSTNQAEFRRQTFVKNVNQLLEVARLKRKEAAEAVGVPYKWLRRMVTTGLLRSDERNLKDLQKLAAYFSVPDVEHLWRPDLVCWLLESDAGKAFWSQFTKNIYTLWSDLENAFRAIDLELLRCLRWQCRERSVSDDAIAFHPASDVVSHEEKVEQILASSRSDHFKEVINVFFDAVTNDGQQNKMA